MTRQPSPWAQQSSRSLGATLDLLVKPVAKALALDQSLDTESKAPLRCDLRLSTSIAWLFLALDAFLFLRCPIGFISVPIFALFPPLIWLSLVMNSLSAFIARADDRQGKSLIQTRIVGLVSAIMILVASMIAAVIAAALNPTVPAISMTGYLAGGLFLAPPIYQTARLAMIGWRIPGFGLAKKPPPEVDT